MKKIYSSLLLSTFLLTGCFNLSPNYEKPIDLDENKSFLKKGEVTSSYFWWKEYHNEDLNEIMETMFNSNQDISIAKKQVLFTLESVKTVNSSYFPDIDVRDDFVFSDLEQMKSNKYGIGFSSFEIDYLGKIKNSLDVYNSDLYISSFNLNYLKMSASYDLVANYLSIVSLSNQINFTEEKIKNLQSKRLIIKENVNVGLNSEINLLDIENEVNIEIRTLNSLKLSKLSFEKSLKFIIGKDIDLKYSSLPILSINENLLVSDKVEKRFDIKIAEEELKQENAKIGIAKAQYFPTLSLNAFLGAKTENMNMLSSSSNYWTISPSIVFNIFDLGKTSQVVEKQKIQKEKALLKYTKTVRNAFIEVRINYLNYIENKKILDNSLISLNNLNKKHKINTLNYNSGLLSKLDYLNSENILFSYKLKHEEILLNYHVSELNLRKSLQGEVF